MIRRGIRHWRRPVLPVLGAGAVLLAGFWLRSLPPGKELPWLRIREQNRIATLYFSDGPHLFPVSRRMPATDDFPRGVLRALIAGPAAASGLRDAIPPAAEVTSFRLENGIARVDLSREFGANDGEQAVAAIVETLTALPGVRAVSVNAAGKTVVEAAPRVPLLYYPSAAGLVAVPDSAGTPRDAVDRFLQAPPGAALTGLPADVRLLKYTFAPAEALVSINLSYTPSLHTLATEKPYLMRSVLLGLIASLTEFPEVHFVRIDFDGHSRLGLGQCSDLLQTPQPRPELLNDERLLGR